MKSIFKENFFMNYFLLSLDIKYKLVEKDLFSFRKNRILNLFTI